VKCLFTNATKVCLRPVSPGLAIVEFALDRVGEFQVGGLRVVLETRPKRRRRRADGKYNGADQRESDIHGFISKARVMKRA
jgi:hypothetical protein